MIAAANLIELIELIGAGLLILAALETITNGLTP